MSEGKDDREFVSLTFRMSGPAYRLLMKEVGNCGCNVSAFLRHAVMTEVLHRINDRKKNTQVEQLMGQAELIGVDSAQNNT